MSWPWRPAPRPDGTPAPEELRTRLADAEAGLRARQDESRILGAVLDAMAEGVWITDPDGVVVRTNAPLERLLRLTRPMTGQRPLFILRHEGLHQAVLDACRSGKAAELEVSLEERPPRQLSVRVAPLGSDLRGSVAVFRDVTELRQLERVRQDFVANVSHELRTPLTAIRGYAETLLDGALKDPPTSLKMVEVIHRQSERLSALVTDLLELARLDAKERALTRGPVALGELARGMAEVVSPAAQAKRLKLQLELSPAVRALGDAKAVEQIALNLLDNAVKYTPEEGQVLLRVEREGTRAVLEVRDTGVGIEPKHLGRLFERFYRVDQGRSRELGGTGLGLSIVKHLVSAMGGEISVQSEPGNGSSFKVYLPAA